MIRRLMEELKFKKKLSFHQIGHGIKVRSISKKNHFVVFRFLFPQSLCNIKDETGKCLPKILGN